MDVEVDRVEDLTPERLRELREQGATRLKLRVAEGDEEALSTAARLGFVIASRMLEVDVDVLARVLERRPRGTSFGSVHVQTDDLPAVERNVRKFVPQLAGRSKGSVVFPPRNGWIGVYDELADRDPSALRRLARELSDSLGVVVVAFGVEEGAIARYLIFDRGRMLDEYLSVQEYYGPLPSGEVVALAANPTLVERLTGASRRAVREAAVHGRSPDELPPPAETIAALAAAMGIEGGDYGHDGAADAADAIVIER